MFLGTGGANPVCDMVAAGIPNPQNYVNYGIIGFAFPVGAPRVFYSQPLPPTPFVNGSFEGPAYSGSAGASATGWQVTQVITNSYLSAYGYPLAPHGNQVAWGGDIRQTLNLAPGTYTMSYRALGRVNQPTTMFLKVNDEIKDTFVPSSQSWTLRTVTFDVDEDQSTFAFISSGAFIDDVKFVVPCPTPNAAPVVTWLAPLDQSHFIVGQTINLAVTATDSDGLINKVEFYDGMDPTPFATVFGPLPNGSQYAYPWPTTSSNLGSHHITAIVTDTCGAETPSTRIIYVDPTPNLLTNGGFESPPTSNVGGMPTGWQGSGGTVGNGYLGATPAPEGQQAAYTRSSISQTVSLNGGNYTLTYKAMTRWYDAPVPLTVRVNGVQLASCTTLNTAWVTCPTVTLTGLAAGQYNIEFVGEGGSFLFVDDARLTAD